MTRSLTPFLPMWWQGLVAPEVLRALNRLDEALAAYDAVIDAFPSNVVARNGRAEVLRALNRLDEALAAYDAGH